MEDIILYLLNFAMSKGISFVLAGDLKPITPSCAVPSKNTIVINTKWHHMNELPFQIAHEIGHVLNQDEGLLYYSTSTSRTKIESEADNKAIDLLLDYCNDMDSETVSYTDFMQQYGIPEYLEQSVKRRYAIYFSI